MKQKYSYYKFIEFILKYESVLPKSIVVYLKKSMQRKRERIHEYNKVRHNIYRAKEDMYNV